MATAPTVHRVIIRAFDTVYSNKPPVTTQELKNLGLHAAQAKSVMKVIEAAKTIPYMKTPINGEDLNNGLIAAMSVPVSRKRPPSPISEKEQPSAKRSCSNSSPLYDDALASQVFERPELCMEIFRHMSAKENLNMRKVHRAWSEMAKRCIASALQQRLEQKMAPYLAAIGKTCEEYFSIKGVNLSSLSLEEAYLHLTPQKKYKVSLGGCRWIGNPTQDTRLWIENYIRFHYPMIQNVPNVAKKICDIPYFFLTNTSESWGQKVEQFSEGMTLREVGLSEYCFLFFGKGNYFYFPITLFGLKREDIKDLVLPVKSAVNMSFWFPIKNELCELTIRPRETQEEVFLPGFGLNENTHLVEIKINESYTRQVKMAPLGELEGILDEIYLPEFEIEDVMH